MIVDTQPSSSWKSSPEFRGTFQILSSCLTTLAFCVWGALHMDIELRTTMMALLHKMGWVLCSIFLPELLVVTAYRQWRSASWIVREVNSPQDTEKSRNRHGHAHRPRSSRSCREQPWTLTHGFYVAMGGFVIDTHGSIEQPDSFMNAQELAAQAWRSTYDRSRNAYDGKCVTLTTEGVHFLLQHDPDFIPNVSKETIMDHSKADGIAKAIQLMQVAWFCINCVCRRAQGLALSLLEVYTLAHAISMLVVYIIWLKKPLDIKEPTVIRGQFARETCALLEELQESEPIDVTVGRVARGSYDSVDPAMVTARRALADRAQRKYGLDSRDLQQLRGTSLTVGQVRMSSWFIIGARRNGWSISTTLALLGALYGGVHCLPWNDEFPSFMQRELWRASAIILTSVPTCMAVTVAIHNYFEHRRSDHDGCLSCIPQVGNTVLLIVAPLLYVAASLYLVVESLRQLLYLPPQAYELPVWSNYWPHFG